MGSCAASARSNSRGAEQQRQGLRRPAISTLRLQLESASIALKGHMVMTMAAMSLITTTTTKVGLEPVQDIAAVGTIP